MVSLPQIESTIVSLDDISINSNKRDVSSVVIDGETVCSTDRFVDSLCSTIGISKSVFNLFTPNEVLERASKFKPEIRITTAKTSTKKEVLAVSSPNKPIVKLDNLITLLDNHGAKDIKYSNGIITSTHSPVIATGDVTIAGDKFVNQFVMNTPVDGYGLPAAFVSLLRLRCSNGAIGYAPAFKSSINIGKNGDDSEHDCLFTISHFIDSYNNEEGFDAIRRRFEAATKSPASLYELDSLMRLLMTSKFKSVHNDAVLTGVGEHSFVSRSDITERLMEVSGDPLAQYGIVSMSSVSDKRMRVIPTKASVISLINIASEIATHRADPNQNASIQAWIGGLISNEFDLEGTIEEQDQARMSPDFFFSNN